MIDTVLKTLGFEDRFRKLINGNCAIKYVKMLETCCENEESLHNFVEAYKNEEEKLAGLSKVAELPSCRYRFIKK